MMVRRLIGHMLGVLVLVAGCGSLRAPQASAQDGERLQAIVTFSVLGDIVQRVGGEAVEVHVLVPAGADAHIFEPAPDDVGALEDAAVVFENGLGFEPWLDDLYEAAASDATRIVVTEGITPRDADAHEEDAGEEHEEEDEHGESDPHVWHDVANVILEVAVIRDALVLEDPAHAATYEANAAAYTEELEALDAYVIEQVSTLAEERRRLVTSHDTFGYFAARYGFEIVGTALGSVSTEGGDPSAEQINDLLDEIEAAGVPAIFAENVSNASLMETIASEAGVTLVPALYTDALGEPGSPGETYLGMIRHNVDTIVGALGE